MPGISIDTAIAQLMLITRRTVRIIAWLLFALTHVALLALALLGLWWFEVTPSQLRSAADTATHQPFVSTSLGMLAALGLSAGAALWAYAKFWRWLLDKLVARYVLPDE